MCMKVKWCKNIALYFQLVKVDIVFLSLRSKYTKGGKNNANSGKSLFST